MWKAILGNLRHTSKLNYQCVKNTLNRECFLRNDENTAKGVKLFSTVSKNYNCETSHVSKLNRHRARPVNLTLSSLIPEQWEAWIIGNRYFYIDQTNRIAVSSHRKGTEQLVPANLR